MRAVDLADHTLKEGVIDDLMRYLDTDSLWYDLVTHIYVLETIFLTSSLVLVRDGIVTSKVTPSILLNFRADIGHR